MHKLCASGFKYSKTWVILNKNSVLVYGLSSSKFYFAELFSIKNFGGGTPLCFLATYFDYWSLPACSSGFLFVLFHLMEYFIVRCITLIEKVTIKICLETAMDKLLQLLNCTVGYCLIFFSLSIAGTWCQKKASFPGFWFEIKRQSCSRGGCDPAKCF